MIDHALKELEEKLDEKTALLIKFQRISMEVNATSPNKNEELHKALESWSRREEETARLRRGGAGGGGASSELKDPDGGPGVPRRSLSEAFASGALRAGGADAAMPLTTSQSLQSVQSSDDDDAEGGPNIIKASVGVRSTPTSPGRDSAGAASVGGGSSTDVVMKAVLTEVDAGLKALERRGDPAAPGAQPLTVVRATQDAVADIMRRVVMKVSHISSTQRAGAAADSRLPPAAHAGAAGGDDNVAHLRRENALLEQRVRQLESGADHPSVGPGEAAAWRSRCDTLVREREAVQTIMEQKIKVLVQSVSNALDVVLHDEVGPGKSRDGAEAREALGKDVSALQRLVNASIQALRNAATQK